MKKLVHEIFDGNSTTAVKQKILFDLLKSPDNKENIIIQGLAGSSKAFLFASVFLQEKHLSCLLFPDKESASYFFDDLVSILGEEYVLFYPSAYK
ncbi:MAG: hypothetical protein PHW82_09910, partial [Bacteroidales bacterium]|nr:hypothetical protein [Bacteroidales bacterium]